MTRQTSIEAYNKIKENGLLSRRRWEVYDILFRLGPLTANETFNILKQEKYLNLSFDSNTRARFTELRELGVIMETQTRPCSITGMNVIEWDVTKELPKKIVKPTEFKCPHCKGSGKIKQERLL
jgi:hypothetical protein